MHRKYNRYLIVITVIITAVSFLAGGCTPSIPHTQNTPIATIGEYPLSTSVITNPSPFPSSPSVNISPSPENTIRQPPSSTAAFIPMSSAGGAPSELDAKLDISKAPTIGETVELTFSAEWVKDPNRLITGFRLEFELYDPSVYYPLGKSHSFRDEKIKSLGKADSGSGAYFYNSMAAQYQPETIVDVKKVVVSGETQWEGETKIGINQMSLSSKICFPEKGEWLINGIIQFEDGSYYISNSLELTVKKDSGSIGWPIDYSIGNGVHNYADSYAPVGVYLNITHAPLVGEKIPLDISVYSIEDLDHASVSLGFVRMDGYMYTYPSPDKIVDEGKGNWEGNLKKEVPAQLSFLIKFPDEGDWAILLMTRASPSDHENTMLGIPIHIDKEKSRFGWTVDHIDPGTKDPLKERMKKSSDSASETAGTAKTIASDSDENNQTKDASFVIGGIVRYENRDGQGLYSNARFCQVDLLNQYGSEFSPPVYEFTNSCGYFNFSLAENPGYVKIKIYTDGNDHTDGIDPHDGTDDIKVIDISSIPYYYQTPYVIVVPESGDLGIITIDNTNDLNKAWWIRDDLESGYQFGLQQDIYVGTFIAQWSSSNQWTTYSKYTPGWYSQLSGQIYISKNSANGYPDGVLHEMGHNVMNNYFGTLNWPNGNTPYPHYLDCAYDRGTAWKEGWATFWAVIVSNSYIFNFPEGGERDIEHFECINFQCFDDVVEGWVAGSLLDLYDVSNDGIDEYPGGFDLVGEAFCTKPQNFAEFWDYYYHHLSDPHDLNIAARAIGQNCIFYIGMGDITRNGSEDMGDVVKVISVIEGWDPPHDWHDANLDGNVNSRDIVFIERFILMLGNYYGEIPTLPHKKTDNIISVCVGVPDQVAADSDFLVNINISEVSDFDATDFDISFNPEVIRLDDVTDGLIGSTPIPINGYSEIIPGTGRVICNLAGATGTSGSGILAVLHFHAIGVASQSSDLILSNGTISSIYAKPIVSEWSGDSISIRNPIITAGTGSGGSISPAGAITVTQGQNQKFIITSNANYMVSDVLIDGISYGSRTVYTFTNVMTDHTVQALFALKPAGWCSPSSYNSGGNFSYATYAFTSDDSYASATGPNKFEIYKNLSIPTIPTGSTIYGILVEVEGYRAGSAAKSFEVSLSWNNSTYTASKNTGDMDTTQDNIVILGSRSDTWGRTWSTSDFTDTNFRLKLVAADTTTYGIFLDHVQVIVYSDWNNPSANSADLTVGDGDGFQSNPTNAYANDSSKASNSNGAADRHIFYNYFINIPEGNVPAGIETRLDWWMDSTSGTNSMSVELSWDGGTSWTAAKTASTERTNDGNPTDTVGGIADLWGHSWTREELSNENFRVRLTCNSSSGSRDFYLDWVPVRVTYEPAE
jgi:hypothetical protein